MPPRVVNLPACSRNRPESLASAGVAMPVLPLLPLVVAAAAASPCATLDLPSALSLAERRSDEVAIKQAELHAAEADQSLARALRYVPEFTVTGITSVVPAAHGNVVQSTNTNRSLRGLGPFVRVDASAVQPIWTWGQLNAARDAANAGYKARALLVKDQVSQVQLRVIQLFWAQATARKLLSIAGEVEKALQQVDEKIDESLKNEEGDITTEDRYRVNLFKAELASRKADAQKGLELAQIGLAATLAMDPQTVQFEAPPLEAPGDELPALPSLLQAAESQRPDLQALDEAIHAREAEVKADEGAMLPAFFIAGQFSFAYAGNRDVQFNPWVNDPFREIGGGVVLGARQNLAFPMLFAKLDKAKAELATLKVQRQGLARLVDVQVEAARTEAESARTKLAAAQASLGSGKAWFRSAALNFGLGVDDAKALLEAYQGYVGSQVNLASASYDLLVARAKLDQLTGKSLAMGEGKCVSP